MLHLEPFSVENPNQIKFTDPDGHFSTAQNNKLQRKFNKMICY